MPQPVDNIFQTGFNEAVNRAIFLGPNNEEFLMGVQSDGLIYTSLSGGSGVPVVATSSETASSVNDLRSTSLIGGGILSINADTTKFDLAAGSGVIVDHSNPSNAIVTDVSWATQTGISVSGIGIPTNTSSFVSINSAGNIVQEITLPTFSDHRDLIFIGRVNHLGTANLVSTATLPVTEHGNALNIWDLAKSLGPINVEGNVFSPHGANLAINKSAGQSYRMGSNYKNDRETPSTTVDAVIVSGSFAYSYRDGGGGFLLAGGQTEIAPSLYDDGTGSPVAVPTNKWTIQRIFFASPAAQIIVQYGQTTYNSLTLAQNAIVSEAAEINPILSEATFRAWLLVKEGETDLTSADTKFISAGKLGISTSSTGGTSTTSLQQAYNNSVDPEITTDSIRNGMHIQEGVGVGGDLFQGLSSNAKPVFHVTSSGNVFASGFLEVGQLRYPDVDGNNGQVLTTDGAGLLFFSGMVDQGENNTASNVGAGEGIFSTKNGVDLEFRSILPSGNITLIQQGNDIIISGAGDGSGDVVGPVSSTDNALARFDTTTGKLIQNSSTVLSDAEILSGVKGFISILPSGNQFELNAFDTANTLTNGVLRITHKAGNDSSKAITILTDINGKPNAKSMEINYQTNGLTSDSFYSVSDITVDRRASTDGVIEANKVSAVNSGTAIIHALSAGPEVNVIRQTAGTFGSIETAFTTDSTFTSFVDVTASFSSNTTNATLFNNNNEYVVVGMADKFSFISFILQTLSSKNIKPTFSYSNGAGGWVSFNAADGTNGMRKNGSLSWSIAQLTTWAQDTVNAVSGKFWIRIRRTFNGTIQTKPVEKTVRTAVTSLYSWSSSGDIKVNSVSAPVVSGTIISGNSIFRGGSEINSNSVLDLTSSEVSQIANIGAAVITPNNWDYLAATNQNVATTSDVTFASISGTTIKVGGNNVIVSGINLHNNSNNIFSGKNGNNLEFKSLVAGSNITLTPSATGVTIAASAAGEANTASNLGSGSGVFAQKNGVDLEFKSLVAGENTFITADATTITISGSAGGGGGETNTASNVGGDEFLFKQKTGVDLEFKGITAGSNITLTSGANAITIANSITTPSTTTDNNVVVWSGTTGGGFKDSSVNINGGLVSGTAFLGDVFDVNFVLDGQGVVLATGHAGNIEVPYTATPLSWNMMGNVSGTLSVDVRRSTYSDWAGPPAGSASIVGSEKPFISAAFKAQDTGLTTWSGVDSGDLLSFHIDAVTTGITKATLAIKMRKFS